MTLTITDHNLLSIVKNIDCNKHKTNKVKLNSQIKTNPATKINKYILLS